MAKTFGVAELENKHSTRSKKSFVVLPLRTWIMNFLWALQFSLRQNLRKLLFYADYFFEVSNENCWICKLYFVCQSKKKIYRNLNENNHIQQSVKDWEKYLICNNYLLLCALWTLVLWSWHWQSPDSSYAVDIVHCYNPKQCFFVMLMTSKNHEK